MRHLPVLRPVVSLSIVTVVLGFAVDFVADLATIAPAQADSKVATHCYYNPSSGKPNPLGMRASVVLHEKNGNTEVVYEQLPSTVGGTIPATIASKRTISFPQTTIAQIRQLMLKDPKYYNELLASKGNSFAPMNALLTCETVPQFSTDPPPDSMSTRPDPPASAAMPAPIPNSKPNAIAQLPDGNYRFWSGTPTKAVLSQDELVKLGGALALIHKKGNQVTAGFGYVDSDFTACVVGTVSGDRVTGQAFPTEGLTNKATEFIPFGPAKFLMVRNPKTIAGKKAYSEAVLDLTGFSRINLGDRAPRKSCS
jgi:hypothetical protein